MVQELPLLIRRQVWVASPKLFLESIAEQCKSCLHQSTGSIHDIRSVGAPARLLSDAVGQSDALFSYFADYCAKQAIQENSDYCLIIQHVLMCLSSNKIKAFLKLHDLALIIDQIKRDGIDDTSLGAVLTIFNGLIHAQPGVGNFLGNHEEPQAIPRLPLGTQIKPALTHLPVQKKAPKRSRPSTERSFTPNKSRGGGGKRKGGSYGYSSDDDDYDYVSDRPPLILLTYFLINNISELLYFSLFKYYVLGHFSLFLFLFLEYYLLTM